MSDKELTIRVSLAVVVGAIVLSGGWLYVNISTTIGSSRHGWVEASLFWAVLLLVPTLVMWPRSWKAWGVAAVTVAVVALAFGLRTWSSAPPTHDRLEAYYEDNVDLPEGFVETGREEHGEVYCKVADCASIVVTVRSDPEWSDEDRAERFDAVMTDEGWEVREGDRPGTRYYSKGGERSVSLETQGPPGDPLEEGMSEVTID